MNEKIERLKQVVSENPDLFDDQTEMLDYLENLKKAHKLASAITEAYNVNKPWVSYTHDLFIHGYTFPDLDDFRALIAWYETLPEKERRGIFS